MNEQEKKYLKDQLITDMVKFNEELERDAYFEDAAIVRAAIERIVQLENAIRELGVLVK